MTDRAPRQNAKQARPKVPKGSIYTIRKGRFGKLHRIVVKETGVLAKNHRGEPLDDGGFGMMQQAEQLLEHLAKRPGATWLSLDAEPGQPDKPAKLKKCDFVLCPERARLECVVDGSRMAYCAPHTEARGFRIPEKTR